MKQLIPAKTFLLGEYLAMQGGPAILLCTEPGFTWAACQAAEASVFHPESPAGRFLQAYPCAAAIQFHDPYQGKGGLGASSAEFLAVYQRYCQANHLALDREDLLRCYYEALGLKTGPSSPSAYDLIAQSMQGLVYLHREATVYAEIDWPFTDLSFLLLHTGKKLPTHQHLSQYQAKLNYKQLEAIVLQARQAFKAADAESLISAVNNYQAELSQAGLLADHSQRLLQAFQAQSEILAAKGCGAMGSDVILLLMRPEHRASMEAQWPQYLASEQNLYLR